MSQCWGCWKDEKWALMGSHFLTMMPSVSQDVDPNDSELGARSGFLRTRPCGFSLKMQGTTDQCDIKRNTPTLARAVTADYQCIETKGGSAS